MLTLQAAVYKEPQVMRHTQAPSKRQENSDENYLTSKKHLQLCKEMPCGHVAQKALAAPAVGFLRSLQFGASPPALRIIASRTTDCNYIYFFFYSSVLPTRYITFVSLEVSKTKN